jgi:hypothetical protein
MQSQKILTEKIWNAENFSLTQQESNYPNADCYATLRDFMEKFDRKIFDKKKFQKKKFRNFSVKFFFQLFLAIGVPQPIWGMPAKIWGV